MRAFYYQKKTKYHASPTTVEGVRFDSKKEAERWQELRLLERAGKIYGLSRQVRYELQPSFTDSHGKKVRAITYIADFVYLTEGGKEHIEDVKGYRTEVYKLKKKMMAYQGHEIEEV